MTQSELEPLRHFYLYAKNHYVESDNRNEDLKIILAHYCGVRIDHISIFDVIRVMSGIVSDGDTLHELMQSTRWCEKSRQLVVANCIIDYLLTKGSIARVKDGDVTLLNLGEPDPNILPLRRETNK